MTTSTPRPRSAARSAVRALVPVSGAALVLAAAPAFADAPVGWNDADPVSGIHWLLWLVALPLAASLLISAFVLVPGFVRGEGLTGRDEHADDEWLGGPRDHDALDSDDDPKAVSGGASATW